MPHFGGCGYTGGVADWCAYYIQCMAQPYWIMCCLGLDLMRER